MVWSWSHTQEAYQNAYENLQNSPRHFLEVTFAEIRAAGPIDDEGEEQTFNEKKYNRALKQAAKLPDDVLADAIWEFAENQAVCDNGGYNAWVCPWGCHTVPFELRDEDEDEDEDEQWQGEH